MLLHTIPPPPPYEPITSPTPPAAPEAPAPPVIEPPFNPPAPIVAIR